MSTELHTPRVNSARLPNYIGKTVRLMSKVLTYDGGKATVQASDGGEVVVHLPRDAAMSDTFVEIIGSVMDATTIRMMTCINLGNDVDMQLVNDTIELIHNPRFSPMFHL